VGAKKGQSKQGKPAGKRSVKANRLALIVFGALFIVLFVGFAVAEGIGTPGVAKGDAVEVSSVSDGTITEADVKAAVLQQASQQSQKTTPKPGSKKYEELQESALSELVDGIWIGGEAEELGISATHKEIESELQILIKNNFKTQPIFEKFMKTSHFTEEEVEERIETQVLSTKIQEQVSNEAPPASKSEISNYYDENKAAQYTEKPSRDIRLVINKNKSEVEKAKEALDKDNSPANWKKVAEKYSSDPTTASKGGLQKGITEELLQGPIKKAIFGSATGEVVGPVNYQGNYLVVETVAIHPEKAKSLKEVESEISQTLTKQNQEEFFSEFVTGFQTKWQARTECASEFLSERCANFKASPHPASAPAACYEANPKTPATECPAPVEQTKPALPGTTTLAKPQGQRLVQRPRPQAKSSESKKGAATAKEVEGSEADGAEAEPEAAEPETGASGE
jgi:parvulin-like peptidyl-prolyl isomerase